MLFDYHTHTVRCKHAEGTMEQYVQAAIAAGLSEIGFSDHLPLPFESASPWNMLPDELPQYAQDVHDLRRKFPQFPIRLGVELDFFSGYDARLRELVASQSLDYVIGSVHYIPPGSLQAEPPLPPRQFCVDSPNCLEEWKRYNVDDVYRAHIAQVEALARSGLCHVIGHLDLPKKFCFRHSPAVLDDYRRMAAVLAQCGVICEINTAGRRKPVGEMYPSLDLLRILNAAGVGITLGSDAHLPQEVGLDFGLAVELARAAGYNHLHRWASPGHFEPVAIADL